MSETNGQHLLLPRVRVTLDDGRVLTAQILNADLLRWDRTAAKHGWPNFETARALHSTFCAWSALRRTGEIPDDWTWEVFSDEHCLQVEGLEPTDGEVVEAANPTRSAAALE